MTSPLDASPPSLTHRPRRRLWRWVWLALALLVIGGIAFAALRAVQSNKAKAAAAESLKKQAQSLDTVRSLLATDVITLTPKPLSQWLDVAGTLEAQQQAVMRARVGGQVVGAKKREGDAVSVGEVLADVDNVDLTTRLAEREAVRAQAQVQVETSRKNRLSQQGLLDKGFISQNAFDATDGTFRAAEAALQAAQAQVKLAQQALQDRRVVNTLRGVVGKRHVEAGDRVTPEAPIYTIINIEALELTMPVPSERAPGLSVGQSVAVEVPGLPVPMSATISRIAPNVQSATRTVEVRATLTNKTADGTTPLKAGTFVNAQIQLKQNEQQLALPLEAIERDMSGAAVWAVEDGRVRRKVVKLASLDTKRNLGVIESGLATGARVLAARMPDLREGQAVSLASAAPAAPAASASTPVKP